MDYKKDIMRLRRTELNPRKTRKKLVARASRRKRACKRTGEPSGTFCGEEEQRNEREMTFDAEHKKVVASDMQLATTWWTIQDSNSEVNLLIRVKVSRSVPIYTFSRTFKYHLIPSFTCIYRSLKAKNK